MRRFSLAACALAFTLAVLPGCGGTDNSTSDIKESDAAKKANENAINAMKGAMESKSTGPNSKAATKAAAGVAPK